MKELFYLNKYLVRYKYQLLLGILFILISNIFTIVPAQIVRHALDYVTETIKIYNIFGNSNKLELRKVLSITVLKFGGLILLMALLKGVFMFFMRQTIIVMSRLVEYDLKNE